MVKIDAETLMMAIQAVDSTMRTLEEEMDADGDDTSPDTVEMHLSYWKTAQTLKEAYEKELTEEINLPPYEKLVRPGNTPNTTPDSKTK